MRALVPTSSSLVFFLVEFLDHHQRKHHVVLVELEQRIGVGEQNAGVENEGTSH